MAHLHSVYDSDSHFSINPVTRAIRNDSSKKSAVIQHDHNSERFTFEIPRYVEGHDMSVCDNVEVHYINIDSVTKEQSSGIYMIDDLQISPDDSEVVIFSWLISKNATVYAGSLNFLVCFKCLFDGMKVSYAWNTAIFTGISVSGGIQNDAEEIIEPYVDVLAQWKAELFEAGGDAVVNVTEAQKQALAAVQTEGEAQVKAVEEAGTNAVNAANIAEQNAKNVMANAIRNNLSGEIVTADDVSSVEHEMSVKVHGKNHFNVLKVITDHQNQVINNGDGTLTVNTSPTSAAVPIIELTLKELAPDLEEGKTYTLSANSSGTHKQIWLNLSQYTWKFGESASITHEMLDSLVFLYASGNSTSAIISNIQIEEGTTATEYTPYVDPETVTVRRCGKNLLDVDRMCNTNLVKNADASFTFTRNEDPAARFSETIPLYIPAYTNFIISLEFLEHNVANKTLYMIFDYSDGTEGYPGVTIAEGKRQMIIDKSVCAIQFYLQSPEAVGAYIKFKNLQIELGETETDYEPYNGAEYTPNADGTVEGVMSVSPNMTILTNTSGVTIDCEYTVDTKKYIDKKIAEMLKGVTE